MRLIALTLLAFALAACTPSQDEQAHQTAEQARHDAKEAAHEVKTEAQKASRELDKGLHDARDKVKQTLDEHK